MILPFLEVISLTSVMRSPLRVAKPIGNHPTINPALIQYGSFFYTFAATATGTDIVSFGMFYISFRAMKPSYEEYQSLLSLYVILEKEEAV